MREVMGRAVRPKWAADLRAAVEALDRLDAGPKPVHAMTQRLLRSKYFGMRDDDLRRTVVREIHRLDPMHRSFP